MSDINDRWSTSIHESAHCICALILGGKCDAIVVENDGGGYAKIHELDNARFTYAVAAGPASRRLVPEYLPPDLPPDSQSVSLLSIGQQSSFGEASDAALSRIALAAMTGPSDESIIAHYSVDGHEDDPSCWERRARFVMRLAEEIVSDNVELIIKLAQELFRRGKLNATEINEIISQKESKA